MQKFIFRVVIYFFILYTTAGFPYPNLSIDLQDMNLIDAIHVLAKFLKLNVIISPSIDGVVTLQLQNAKPEHMFDLLLASQNLAKWQIGNVLYIAPRDELIKRQEEELKWQKTSIQLLPLITRVFQINYAKAVEIVHLLKDAHLALLSARGDVRVDERTNTICIQDVATRLATVEHLIQRLDVPVKQILIEARLISIDSDFERELGLHFAVQSSQFEERNSGLQKAEGYSLAVAKLADGSLLDIKLAALENAGHAELISSPRLFTENQQSASIEAGEEVPYQETSESGGTAVVFKKAVLGLRVTPQVLPGDKVLLKLKINQDRPTNKLVQGVPTISTREITTNVLIRAGQTVILGGIYETNYEFGQKGLPLLSQLPMIGWLFRQQNTRKNKRELLVLVTPRIHIKA